MVVNYLSLLKPSNAGSTLGTNVGVPLTDAQVHSNFLYVLSLLSQASVEDINLLALGNYENVSVPGQTYNDGNVSAPFTGTVGTATALTAALNTVNPLFNAQDLLITKTAVNAKGQGYSVPFTIPKGLQGRELSLYFHYLSTIPDLNISVFIRDVTNSVNLVLSQSDIAPNSAGITGRFSATFQPNSTSTSYLFIVHVNGTTATAGTLEIDNLVVTEFVPASTSASIAGVAITANQIVSSTNAGLVLASNAALTTPGNPLSDIIGVAIAGASIGQSVITQRSGPLQNFTTGLSAGTRIFLGTAGGFVTDPSLLPVGSFKVFIGTMLNATDIMLDIGTPELVTYSSYNLGGVRSFSFGTNPFAYEGIAGWSTYVNPASSQPTNGAGGASILGVGRALATQIISPRTPYLSKPASNVQGQGFAFNFSIPPGGTCTNIQIDFWYRTTGTYALGDISVWVYDIAASTLSAIVPNDKGLTGNALPISGYAPNGSPFSYFSGYFTPLTATSSNYRLIFHIGSTSSAAFVMYVDQLAIFPQSIDARIAGSSAIGGLFYNGKNPGLSGSWHSSPTYPTQVTQVLAYEGILIPALICLPEVTSAPIPPFGGHYLYFKADNNLYYRNNDGLEFRVGIRVWPSNLSFPAGFPGDVPTVGDEIYRTDLDQWYKYNGTTWTPI